MNDDPTNLRMVRPVDRSVLGPKSTEAIRAADPVYWDCDSVSKGRREVKRLTKEQIAALKGQALVDAVAERVMGWTLDGYSDWSKDARCQCLRELWRPHEDHNDAARVMDRIAELELQDQFTTALLMIVDSECNVPACVAGRLAWGAINASPTDRCRAALMAVEGER